MCEGEGYIHDANFSRYLFPMKSRHTKRVTRRLGDTTWTMGFSIHVQGGPKNLAQLFCTPYFINY